MFNIFNRKPKMKVEVIAIDGISTTKKVPKELGYILIRKENKKEGVTQWAPKYTKDCIILEKKGRFFKKTIPKLFVYEDGLKCISFNPVSKKTKIATWDKKTVELWLKSEALRRSGEVKVKHELPFVFWILAMLTVVNVLFQFMDMAGFQIG